MKKEMTELETRCKALWDGFCETGYLPDNIPPNPDEVYADEWMGWADWLGIDQLPTIEDPTLSFKDSGFSRKQVN